MARDLRIVRFPGGLKVRMAVVATSLVLAVALAGALAFTKLAASGMNRQFEESMQSLATNLGRNAAYGVFVESGDAVRELADHLLEHEDVTKVVITVPDRDDARVSRVIHSGEKPGAPPAAGTVEAKVLYDAGVDDEFATSMPPAERPHEEREIGLVRLSYSRARLDAELERTRNRIWALSAIAALIASAVAVWLAQRMTQPLEVLNDATARVAAGDLDVRVSEVWDDEIAALARSFNGMTDALKASRQQLAETYGELARKDRLATLGQFTAVIAHELKNPLGVILSSAQIIANPKRTQEQKDKAAQFIIDEVRRLNADLTGFLNFARPKPPEIRPTDLGDLAERAVSHWKTSVGNVEKTPTGEHPDAATGPASLRVSVTVAPGTPRAAADPDQVHQALLNLLINAAQAMAPREGAAGKGTRIEVAVRRTDDGRVALVVDDDGPGMPDDVRTHAFEPFFTTKKRGSGLGLAVVDQVARAHGGTVELDSRPGEGTRFTLVFPAAAESTAAATPGRIRHP